MSARHVGHEGMSRRAALLFISASAIWGSSFLLIRVAVRDVSPSALVLGRTVLGAAVLVPVAVRTGAFHGLRRMFPAIVVLTMLNMCLPIFLTAWAEQHIASSATGILIATDSLFTALLALWLIRTEAVNRRQLAGLVLGFVGVVALLGLDFRTQVVALLGAGAVLLSAAGYAASALLYRRWIPNAPPLGVSALMMLCSSIVFALPAATDLPRHIPGETDLLALVTLGIVNTGLLSWLYFALVREAGAAVTSLITYVVPVVALVLGVSLLGESLTSGAIVGLVLIVLGVWLATGTRRQRLGQHSSAVRDRENRARYVPDRAASLGE
jgi:drug/metabolite transporter (DMT)-like permease